MKRKWKVRVTAWSMVAAMTTGLITMPMAKENTTRSALQYRCAAADMCETLGQTSDAVKADVTVSNHDGSYYEYYVTVKNQSNKAVSDWIMAIPLTGISAIQDWTSWASVQAVCTDDYLYIYPTKDSVILAGQAFGNEQGSNKINYTGNKEIKASDIKVYFVEGTVSTNAFQSVINAASLKGNGSSGSSSSGGGTALTDTTKLVNTDMEYNFAKLLQYALYFYDANMCGPQVEEQCSLSWRKNCHTCDTKVNYNGKTVDVSGGFHDAGDHDKFGVPQGYAASMLGINFYEFEEAFEKTGQSAHLKKITDYFCDYFVRCTMLDSNGEAESFCYQVGDGASHNLWVAPEEESIERPAYFVTANTPATDHVGEAAAALAINYVNFGNETYLTYAKKLFALAQKNEKQAQSTQGGGYYSSTSWADDYCLAAAWLYKATGDIQYKNEFAKYSSKCNCYSWPSWEDVGQYALYYGADDANALAANITAGVKACTLVDNGYAWLSEWGSARYNCNLQHEGLLYDKVTGSNDYSDWAEGQMKYLMGNSTSKQCYIVGYNENASKYPHHRASSQNGGFPDQVGGKKEQKYTLIGALVGGIENTNGTYHDDASDYYCNEVAIDYNAAFVGAAAALYLRHAGESDQQIVQANDVDAPEEIKTFYTADGNQSSNSGNTGSAGNSTTQDTNTGNDQISVDSVEIKVEQIELSVGETVQLNAQISPNNATNQTLNWSTSDSSVVAVSSGGVLSAKKQGNVTITVTTADGNKKDTCTVIVTAASTGGQDNDVPSVDFEDYTTQDNPSGGNNNNAGDNGSSDNSGNTGNSGNAGNSGANDNSGNTGNSGTNDNSGNTGNSGTNDNSGNTGNSGTNNNSGNTGNSGTNNNSGNTSNGGANDNSGNTSNGGANDNSGNTSNSGTSNNNGNTSNNGTSNNNGNTGNSGTSNNNGNTGNSGTSNNNGNTNNSGTGNNSGNTSNNGTSNDSGNTSNSGTSNNNGNTSNSGTGNNNANTSNATTQNTTSANQTNQTANTYQNVSPLLITSTDTVQLVRVTGFKKKCKKQSITLSWKKQQATGYNVYIYKSSKKKYVFYKTTYKNTITIKKLKKNTTYKFKVKPYYVGADSVNINFGPYSKVVKAKTKKK